MPNLSASWMRNLAQLRDYYRCHFIDNLMECIQILMEQKDLLIEIKEWLSDHQINMAGPVQGNWGWILEHPFLKEDHNPSLWIEIDLKGVKVVLHDRYEGRHSSMEFDLHDPSCFDRLAKSINISLNEIAMSEARAEYWRRTDTTGGENR